MGNFNGDGVNLKTVISRGVSLWIDSINLGEANRDGKFPTRVHNIFV